MLRLQHLSMAFIQLVQLQKKTVKIVLIVILFSIFIQAQVLQGYTLQVIQLIVVYQIIIFIKLRIEVFRALIMEFTFLIQQDIFKY